MKKNGICQFYNYTIGIKVRIKEFLNMMLTKSDVDVFYTMAIYTEIAKKTHSGKE
jgi:hypothetical protein